MPLVRDRRTYRRGVLRGASTLAAATAMLAVAVSALPAVAAQAAVPRQASLTAAVSPRTSAATTSALSCVYRVIAIWPDGFAAEITCTNASPGPVTGWTISWTWPGNQQLTGGWSGSFTQSGADVTVTSVSSDTIWPGASITIGFTATGTAPAQLSLG